MFKNALGKFGENAVKVEKTVHKLNEFSHWWYCLLVFFNQHEKVAYFAGAMVIFGVVGFAASKMEFFAGVAETAVAAVAEEV